MSGKSKEKEKNFEKMSFFFQLFRSHFLARTSHKNHQCSDIFCLYIPSLLEDEVLSFWPSPRTFSPIALVYVSSSHFSLFLFSFTRLVPLPEHYWNSWLQYLYEYLSFEIIENKKRWMRYIGILLDGFIFFLYRVSISV